MEQELALREELEAIQAIYCGPNEFQFHSRGSATSTVIFTVSLKCGSIHDVKVTFDVSKLYPSSPPKMSIQSPKLTKEKCSQLRRDAEAHSLELLNEPMILQLCSWIQDHFDEYAISLSNPNSDTSAMNFKCNTALLHLDHMRSKAKYIKTIVKWTGELGLTGRLIFCKKLILILLQGLSENIKTYISQNRSVNVDVDSKGRPCKERMLSVLAEVSLEGHQRIEGFRVVEYDHISEIEALFKNFDLDSLYQGHVLPVVR